MLRTSRGLNTDSDLKRKIFIPDVSFISLYSALLHVTSGGSFDFFLLFFWHITPSLLFFFGFYWNLLSSYIGENGGGKWGSFLYHFPSGEPEMTPK